MGINVNQEAVKDKSAEGMATLIVDVQNSYAEKLTKEKLFDWHKMIFPAASNINIGTWRTHVEPMQVVSGIIDRPTVHFEAPPSKQVPSEMDKFLDGLMRLLPMVLK